MIMTGKGVEKVRYGIKVDKCRKDGMVVKGPYSC